VKESSPLWRKLRATASRLVVIDPPQGFLDSFPAPHSTRIEDELHPDSPWVLCFATTLEQVERFGQLLASLTTEDPVVWCAYPKASSKRYRCEFNRDSGWESIGHAGFEPVAQVAIDEDWSAIRFRQTRHIKTLSRTHLTAISEEGRRRAPDSPSGARGGT
jgi:hypothetical protein